MADDDLAQVAPTTAGLKPVGMVQSPPTGGGLRPVGMVAAAEEPGMLSRLWQGMLGQDVSKVGRVGMGMADPVVGAAQLAAHRPMSGPAQAAWSMMPPEMRAREEARTPQGPEGMDQFVRQREAAYEGGEKRAGLSGGLSTEWARLLGNVASPVNVAAGGAASALGRGASLIPRLGAYGAGGAAVALAEPQARQGAFDFPEIAKRAGFGALGGAAGGALGDVIGSGLSRAIAGNSPQAVDAMVNRVYRQVVKPGRAGRTSAPALEQQDNRILTTFDQIIANRPALQLTDEAGNVVSGQLPRSLRQFGEAADQTKQRIFQQYDQMAKAAGATGVTVDLTPIAGKLQTLAQSLVDVHPSMANDAMRMAQAFMQRGSYSPNRAQATIESLNKIQGYPMRNPVHDLATRELRAALDQTIAGAAGPGYQALRTQYGALRSVEKDVAAAVQREANKLPGGLGGLLADSLGGEEILRGIVTFNPRAVVTGVGLKAAQRLRQYVNSPNRAIEKLFALRALPPSGPIPSGIGAAMERGLPAAGVETGGAGAAAGDRKLRPSVGAY